MAASVGCIFGRHDSDEVDQLLELLMRETKQIAARLGPLLTIIIFKRETRYIFKHLLLKEFLVLVLELLENIVIVKKFLYRAVGLVE